MGEVIEAVAQNGATPHPAKLPEAPKLPEPVARRGITEAQWRTLINNLFPGAKPESVMMVWDYCVARKLDPLKKPCHIVPMEVKVGKDSYGKDKYEWRDVVMPGIYEYRMTATRTGQYLGHSAPLYGPIVEFQGRQVPESCAITVYRWNDQAKVRAEYPVELLFSETCATKRDGSLNRRWSTAPRQMLTKCTEAAALREAFPDELGGTHIDDEMIGRELEPINVTPQPLALSKQMDGYADIPADWIDKHVSEITDLINQDKEELVISQELNEYLLEAFPSYQDGKSTLYAAVLDEIKRRGIMKKGDFRLLLNKANNVRGAHQ
jgi:phage recombination protein Bet